MILALKKWLGYQKMGSLVTTALHELESKGFVRRNRERGINGQVKGQNWELDVHGSLV